MKILILIILCFATSSCSKAPDKDFYIKPYNNVEVYSDTYLFDIVDTNGELSGKNYLLETTKLGKHKVNVEFTYKKKNYTQEFIYNVVDTTAPKIFSTSNKTVYLSSETEICNLALIGDNYDKAPTCIIKGEYDLNTKGAYKLQYFVKDDSGNENSFNFTLNVVEKPKTNNTNNDNSKTETNYLPFEEVIAKYKNDNTEIGLDVSKWQKEIDFTKVKDAGAEFVIIRIGVHGGKGYDITEDEYFETNFKNAKEAGLKVGVYFYSTATSIEESISHANWVINRLNGEKLDFPIAFDWENWNYWNYYTISFYDINIIADVFIETLKDSGYEGMLYGSKSYLETIWTNKKNYPVWLAHYTTATTYSEKYLLWQLSNIGKIDGIDGHVDINILYN